MLKSVLVYRKNDAINKNMVTSLLSEFIHPAILQIDEFHIFHCTRIYFHPLYLQTPRDSYAATCSRLEPLYTREKERQGEEQYHKNSRNE